MAYEFNERENEPELQTSSSRSGAPPRKLTGIGVLDHYVPPKPQLSVWLRIIAAIVVIGIAVLAFLMLLSYR